MKNFKLYVFLISFIVFSCERSDNLINSKWENKMDDCISYIHFLTEKNYEYFDCELGEKFYGTYSQKDNTILIEQLRSEYDIEFKENSRHRTNSEKYKLSIYKDSIRFVKKWNSTSEFWESLSVESNLYILTPARARL